MTPASKRSISVNGKAYEAYFPIKEHQSVIVQPLADLEQQFTVTAVVAGGGVAAQATAVRHGIARGLIEFDKELRIPLKKKGYLMRDPRVKERKKPGLKKARKSPQWSKR
jgi:small subunit ribosomal protein S9